MTIKIFVQGAIVNGYKETIGTEELSSFEKRINDFMKEKACETCAYTMTWKLVQQSLRLICIIDYEQVNHD